MHLSDQDLRGRTGIGADGHALGEVAATLLDCDAWWLESLQVTLRKQIADRLGAFRSMFHAGTVEIPCRLVQSVGEGAVQPFERRPALRPGCNAPKFEAVLQPRTKASAMSLADFIRENHHTIIQEWETFARTLQPTPGRMSQVELRDHAEQILQAIAADLDQPQSGAEQAEKSHGRGEKHRMGEVGQAHATARLDFGFKLDQLVAEYRALRASILRLWEQAGERADAREMTRFHEAIDESLAESTHQFTETMERYRDTFLAILGHDLRSPLTSIKVSATMLGRSEVPGDRRTRLASQIGESADRMNRMVGDLLDLTRTHLGAVIPINRATMDLEPLCRQVVGEFQAGHPDRRLEFEPRGDLRGEWDGDRLAQVITNLVGNALQHGDPRGAVRVAAWAEQQEVLVEVHNDGPPIPAQAIPTLFEPLVRHPSSDPDRSSSLGLGLYIAREVALAHGGGIDLTSTLRDGTTFRVRLPRRAGSAPSARDGLGEERHSAPPAP